MNTNVINTALSNVNADRTLEAVRKAQGIIGNVERELKNLGLLQQQMKESQEAITKMASSEITFETVTGRPRPTNPTTTEATIIKSVEAIVTSRQADVESRSTQMASDIANKLDAIRATQKRIDDLRSELAKVAAATVEAADIIG